MLKHRNIKITEYLAALAEAQENFKCSVLLEGAQNFYQGGFLLGFGDKSPRSQFQPHVLLLFLLLSVLGAWCSR